jgi:choline dehydrogenase
VKRRVTSIPLRVFNRFFGAELDPNDWRVQEHREDMYIYALFTGNSQRFGTRELIEETAAALSNKLIIKTHTLVTRMLFSATAAIGAEYIKREYLLPSRSTGQPRGA